MLLPSLLAAGVLLHSPADPAESSRADIVRIEAELARHRELIAAQQREINELRAERDSALEERRGAGIANSALLAIQTAPAAAAPAPAPTAPVGQRPPREAAPPTVAAPQEYGVLTPPGRLVVEPAIEYVQNSNPRLVFRGVEITPGVQLGVIEASDAQRSTGVATLSARYGLTSRLELEVRAPFVVRRDRITTLSQREESATEERKLDGRGIGDAELAGRFQLTTGQRGGPVILLSGRMKTPTGEGPYEVRYDEAGIARELATGSGFWGAEGGVSMLYATDPAVIFGGVTYLVNFARDVDREIGDVQVGRVDPGDSIGASLGFGLSLNPRFGVSFGYSYNYVFATKSELGASRQRSQPLQLGSFQMGFSYRLRERLTLSSLFEAGVTSEAPDFRVMLRAPYAF